MATFLTKKHLSRRTFLRSGSVALGLPFLDAMVPAGTALAKTDAAPKLRAGFFYIPHGAIMNNTPYGAKFDTWSSTGKGANFKLGKTLASLEPYKKYVTTFDNIENLAALGSVHTYNPATWLSCMHPDTQAKGANMSITLDQIVAKHIGQTTALPSLEVCSETTIQVAACGGSGCYYASTTSYAGPHSPLPMEYNPRKVYIELLGEGDTAAQRAALLHENKSLLDMVTDRAKALDRTLGAGDRARMSDYLDTVRELERRVSLAEHRKLSNLHIPNAPAGVLENFDKQVRLMFDLVALAYQADLTRVVSYVMVSEGTNRTYNFVGVPDAFHPVSHHSNDPERIRKLQVIERYHMERFADFLKKLAETKEGDGSILDHSLFLYGSNMSNSNQHDIYPLPEVLVGGANGAHVGGKNVTLRPHTPLSNLHLTFLEKCGIKQKSFGSGSAASTGVITEV